MSTTSKHQVMACGACAVVVDEQGEVTTSIDNLVNGVKRLFGKGGRPKSVRHSGRQERSAFA